ncbi:hypothetical protein EUTSA_v10019723mg [Eutrema salsugineum]|uniref:Auxin-responsive protein n=1 Tax=Eutrema salsugineum TaxID=72664 RepID=V4K7W5_EUTSA|nr:hypothetical protein EUTSA_v10019723mg [Eutrema salsugineum]
MSPESVDLGGSELTLALPGAPIKASDGQQKSGNKRRFIETIDLKLGGRLVGWPPVKTARRRKHVKVAVDGVAYLRKVDLGMYDCYGQLFTALENMFQGIFNVTTALERNGEFMATYEDKDGDWMLVGDVPWMMFVESCKRMRLMKTGDAIGLGSAK